jgi:putative endonuclease
MSMEYWVYVIRNRANGRIYIGQTEDLNRRLVEHNDPHNQLSQYTKRHQGPWVLIHSEQCHSRSAAVRRERFLKSGQDREILKSILPR